MKTPIKLATVLGPMISACAVYLAATSFSLAQVAPAQPASATNTDDETITMSAFTVTSTAGKGYTSPVAVGLKMNELLMRIPQAVTMITSDFIEDLGYNDSAKTLQYAGVFTAFGQESLAIRGTRVGNALLDEMPENATPTDNVNIDSIVVLRGPAATLYRGASLGGLVLKNSKWPLLRARNSATFLADQHGLIRGEFDSTGPIGSRGEVKFAYRVVGMVQHGDTYFRNVFDNRKSIHPTLQMAYKNTLVRVAVDYQVVQAYPSPNNIPTPDGRLYTGAGRRESYFPASGNSNDAIRRGLKFIITQKLSDNWNAKVSAETSKFTLYGTVAFVSAVNWPAQTMNFQARLNHLLALRDDVQFDVNGKYQLGSMPMQTTFGSVYNETDGANWFIGSPTFGTVTVPINDPRMHLIRSPAVEEIEAVRNKNNLARRMEYNANAFIQQTVDVIPNRLTLVAGVTYQKLKTNNVTNLITLPPPVVTKGAANLHRYGVVFNVTKDAMIYAMESTTFTPSSPFQIDINGNVLPGPEGKGQELGFKTAFLDGRISSTFSVFKIELSNQAFFSGIRPDGVNFFVPIGTTTQKGFDFDLSISPLANLEFTAAFYNGKVRDQTGAKVPNSYNSHASLVGRYKFQEGALKGLTTGMGFTRVGGRSMGRGAYNTGIVGQGATIELKTGNLVNMFASYKVGPRLILRANIENLLDEAYIASGQIMTSVNPSIPRTLSMTATYEF